MSEGKFTTKATVLWGAIPKEARERILANVFSAPKDSGRRSRWK